MAWDFFGALGIAGVEPAGQHASVTATTGLATGRRWSAYYTPLRAQLCEDCRRRLEINPLRLLDCKRDAGLVARAPLHRRAR